ncbi:MULTISPECIES: TRAP transporter small permease [Anaerotruncus]|jgi:TRAP-type C4-dicarboxylate transport system permease small subunit|uniref:TRAP transporter small permease n=1 Tax=Anaerotruncus TaxID=244127 RepID=UPI0008335879|nr:MULTISPECIES: TRAP transporter small permease [Anaerotruncus]RGX54746.1 TRAP transporter small permease [Anaerotruncus sp. AF02-27]
MLRKISDIIYKISGYFVELALMAIVVLVFLQVISRYVFQFSIDWAQELTVYLLIWMVFMGCSMGMRDNQVVSLTLVTDQLPRIAQELLKIVVNLLLIFFFVVCTIGNVEIIQFAMNRISPVLKIKMGYISAAFSVSAVIMSYNCLLAIGDTVKGLFGKNQKEVPAE